MNGNGIVSLAEFDRWVVNEFPLLNHKPALMRAFKQTTTVEGGGEDFVHRKDFANVRFSQYSSMLTLSFCVTPSTTTGSSRCFRTSAQITTGKGLFSVIDSQPRFSGGVHQGCTIAWVEAFGG